MLTIGITTYNRIEVLRMMAQSFYSSKRPYPYEIRIYDDCSYEYDLDVLREIFPDAVSVVRNQRNEGADANMAYMMQDFLKNGGDALFIADADLIFSVDWMEKAMPLLTKTQGVLSLLNVPSHETLQVDAKTGLCRKWDVGAAGSILSKSIVELIFREQELNIYRSFDWQWCDILNQYGIPIYVTENSLVQHIGFTGYNASNGTFDYGKGFVVDSIKNGQHINDALENYSKRNQFESVMYHHFLHLFPYEKVPYRSRVVLYGAGKVGSDYKLQIEDGRYCTLVGMVDQNYERMDQILGIQSIHALEYDIIVISIENKVVASSVCKELIQNWGIDEKKIVFGATYKPIDLKIENFLEVEAERRADFMRLGCSR